MFNFIFVAYLIVSILPIVLNFKTVNKSFLSSSISGVVLLSYAFVLFQQQSLDNNWYIVLLACALLQLSTFETKVFYIPVKWYHHLTRFLIHGYIIYMMLLAK